MKNEEKKHSPVRELAEKTLFEAFKVLQKAGGSLPGRDVMTEVERRIELSSWDKERYKKTGYIRWQSTLHFYTIDAIKAGLMQKKKRWWKILLILQ